MDLEQIKENAEIGQNVMTELMKLNDTELSAKIKDILQMPKTDEIFDNNPDCIRTIKNGKVDSIEFWFYDGIVIGSLGISLKPEHGPTVPLINFNKYFTLNP